MKPWGVLPSDNTVWWVILWIVITAFFVGVAWFIMEVIDYYVVLPARTAFAICTIGMTSVRARSSITSAGSSTPAGASSLSRSYCRR